MKGKINFLTAVIFFIAGITLIVLHNEIKIMEWIVMILGAAILLPGLINIIVSAASRKGTNVDPVRRRAYVWGLVASVFCIALGIAMLIAANFFAGVIAYLFAAILIATGFYHIMAVSYLARPYVLPAYYYIIPVLLVGAGAVILFTGVRLIDNVVVLILGIGMVCSAANSLLEYIATHPSRIKEPKQIEPKQIEEKSE